MEVQIDDSPWHPATTERTEEALSARRIWYMDWPNLAPGEHRVTGPGLLLLADVNGNTTADFAIRVGGVNLMHDWNALL